MDRDLVEAHNRFTNAESVTITTQWVSWPEYEIFVDRLISFTKLSDGSVLDQKTRAELHSYWDLRRMLRGTPLHPEEFFTCSIDLETDQLGGELGVAQKELRISVLEVCKTENPMRLEMNKLLQSEKQSGSDVDRTVYLLVSSKQVPKVNDVLDSDNTFGKTVQAVSPTQARRSSVVETMMIFGSPENYANYFKQGNEKSREVAWIFNSPAARKLVLFQLADCADFDSSRYEIWAGSNQFKTKSNGVRPAVFLKDFEQSIRIDPIQALPTTPGDPVVESYVVHLLDGKYIYYSDLVPPKPTCVRAGEIEVEIDDYVRASSLQPGDVLLIRTGVASHSFLRSHAKVWLETRFGVSEANRMIEIADAYKARLRGKYNDSGFVSRLVSEGMEDHYVRHQILRAHIDSTIATQKSENFIQIAQDLELDYGQDEWSAIVNIQTAHRQAGHIASQELRDIVRGDDSWQDVVNEPGVAKLRAGSIGELVLIPVVQQPEQKISVPVSSLGHLQNKLVLFHG
jgi:hypothetical protein